MRLLLPVFALTFATPALAQAAPAPLGDPYLGQRVAGTAEALTRALMNVHTGELRAAVEGRSATREERRRTVSDEVGGPAKVRDLQRQIAATGPVIQQAADRIARSMPAIMKAMRDIDAEVKRATANLPDPNYPVR